MGLPLPGKRTFLGFGAGEIIAEGTCWRAGSVVKGPLAVEKVQGEK